jgi:tetratricopeptide (TPR) repeat protein
VSVLGISIPPVARLLPALALTVLSATAGDQPWLRVASPNFEVFTAARERAARETIQHFEEVRAFFLAATGLQPFAGAPVRIVFFQSERDYEPYRVSEGAAAYACGAIGQAEIVMGSSTPEQARLATHEYFHILVKPFQRLPVWLNEGGAEVYSTLHPAGGKLQFGDVLPAWSEKLQSAKWLDFETLFAVDHTSPYYRDDAKRPLFYAESWALAHMLFVSGQYRPRLAEFLRQIGAGASEAVAFQRAYGKGERDVWKDLQQYVRAGRFKPFVYDLPMETAAVDIQVRPATPLETDLVLARVLGNIRKDEEARRIYDRLELENPRSPELYAALAYYALRRQQKEEARSQFAKAAEYGSSDAQMYYDYASLMAQVGERERDQIPVLRKAVELDPGLSAAQCRLAALGAGGQCPENRDAVLDRPPIQLLPLAELEDHAAAAPEPASSSPRSVEGTLNQIDCLKDGNRILVGVDGRPVRLLLDDQLATFSLHCGRQKARHVLVQYEPTVDTDMATIGVVRAIEFK